MSWKRLTIDDLRLILSEDETQKLDTLSLNEDITEPINQTILLVSNTWRGAMKGKGYEIDPRDGYIPSAYAYWVLVHSRYAVWSRFPNSSFIAIDEVRKKEYEQAIELLKSPSLDTDKVEWFLPDGNPNPELSAYTKDGTGGSSMLTPWLRFPDDVPMIEDWKPWTWNRQQVTKPSEVIQ